MFQRWPGIALGICGALLGLAGPGARVARAQSIEPRVETLDNGLQMILIERHDQPMVAAGLFFNVGSVNDPEGRSGIAHMFEHMMFKGTHVIGTDDFAAEQAIMDRQNAVRAQMNAEMERMRVLKRRGEIHDVLDPQQWTPEYKRLKEEFDRSITEQRTHIKNNEFFNIYMENGGAMINAGTMEDLTMYFVQLPANKVELFFWMESDRLANAVMREFYVERDNVREERRLRTESTPTGRFDEAFEALFWQTHAYGVPVLGWASEVESITHQDVQTFYARHYVPNNATLAMVGDFRSDEVVDLARRYFGRIPAGPTPPQVVTEEPAPIAERRFSAEVESNPIVTIRYLTVAMGHPDEAALSVVTELLSGKTGRLYKRMVNEADAVIGQPQSSNLSRKYSGYLEINATVKEGHTLEEVEQMILEEVARLREGEIPERELQKVKNQVLSGAIRALQSNLGLLFQIGVYETWFDWTYINESPKRMLAVTPDDVHRVVKQYLDPATRTVAFYRTKAGAGGGEDPVLTALLADAPPEARTQLVTLVEKVRKSEDPAQLAARLQMMEQMAASEQVPPEQKAIFDYLIKVIKERIAVLESAAKQEGQQ